MRRAGLIFGMLIAISQAAWSQLRLPVVKQGFWGFIDSSGALAIPAVFEYASAFEDHAYATVKQDGKYGIIDRKGDWIVAPSYKEIRLTGDSAFCYWNRNGWNVADMKGRNIFPEDYEAIRIRENHLLEIHSSQGIGMANLSGKILVPPLFDSLEIADSNGFKVKGNFRWGAFSPDGKWVLDTIYRSVFSSGPSWIATLEKEYALFGPDGKQLSGFEYQDAEASGGGYYLLQCTGDQYFMYNPKSGKIWENLPCTGVMFPSVFGSGGINYDYVMMSSPRGWTLYDASQTPLLALSSTNVYTCENIFLVDSAGFIGLFDAAGKMIYPHRVLSLSDFHHRLTVIETAEGYGILNANGNLLVKPVTERIDLFEKTAKVYRDGKVDVLEFDENGNLDYQTAYTNVLTFFVGSAGYASNAAAPVFSTVQTAKRNWFYDLTEKLWGLKNTTGDTLVKPRFEEVYNITGIDVSIVGQPIETYRVKMLSGMLITRMTYAFVDDSTGAFLSDFSYAGFNPSELSSGHPVRLLHKKGNYAYFDPITRTVKNHYTFIEPGADGLTRYCKSGTIHYTAGKKGHSSIAIDEIFAMENQMVPVNMGIRSGIFSKHYFGSQKYIGISGSWSYLEWPDSLHYPGKFSWCEKPVSGLGRAYDNYSWTVRDTLGKIIIKGPYEKVEIVQYDKTVFIQPTIRHVQQTYINAGGEVKGRDYYDRHLPFENGYGIYADAKGYGFYSLTGESPEDLHYKKLGNFSEGLAAAKKDRYWGYIDSSGLFIIEEKFTKALDFSEGIAAVKYKGKWGFINASGTYVLEPQYDEARSFSHGKAWVKSGKKWKWIDMGGKEIRKVPGEIVKSKQELDFFLMDENGRKTIIDTNGVEKEEGRFTYFKPYNDIGYIVMEGRNWGFVDTNLHYYAYKKADRLLGWWNGYALVRNIDNEFMIMDSSGEVTLTMERAGKSLLDGMFITKTAKGYAVLDISGDTIFSTPTRLIGGPYGGAWIGVQDRHYVLLDREGNIIAANLYTHIEHLRGNLFSVCKDGKWGIMDAMGNWRSGPDFIVRPAASGDGFIGVKDEFTGMYDVQGNEILPVKYDMIVPGGEQWIRVQCAASIGYMDMEGNWLWKPTH